MDPIGASPTWQWFGYEDAWIVLDGAEVQSVSGGGHWGGGMFINAWDLGRFGLLTMRRGRWGDRRVLSEAWVRYALTPTSVQPNYGVMNWYLNTDRKQWPSAPASSFGHIGNGTNIVWASPEHDLVVVARWIETGALDELFRRVLGAVRE
jgi:CubicO group peptidase (beta-lactamase class C family)